MENDSGERYGVRYRYSFLQTTDLEVGDFEAPEEALVGAINPYYEIDRRDSALNPRDGYRLGGELEVASRVLGSEVDYRLLDLGGSYHQEFTTGWWAHAALRAAIIEASSQDEIPLNKRFLPGGASSIRGYTDGEAAALNADGDIVGSEALLLTNLEVERALAQSFSGAIFYDALWTDLDAEDFPGDDFLHSVGLGLRYETPLGPLRLEYGYNLNPRPRDPAGTFHVSLGAPF
jgi:outer membrane translocation and assembly module TamA